MDRLPQHIYDDIAALLDGPDVQRPGLATISHRWQMAIERLTFRCIVLKSTELERFEKIIQHGRRRYYVKSIGYRIVLPAYSDEVRGRFEREDDRRVNNEAFTAAIHGLFQILKSWDGSIMLRIQDAYSIADHDFLTMSNSNFGRRDNDHVNLAGFQHHDSPNGLDLWSWRHRYSYLDLLPAPSLPSVPVVKSLHIQSMSRNISPRAAIGIVAKLPNLRTVYVFMSDDEMRYSAFRRMLRHELTQTILNVLPTLSEVRDLDLRMHEWLYWNRAWGSISLSEDNTTSDPLSSAIRTTTAHSRTLRRLSVMGIIDGSLLWPGPDHTLLEPYWQNLEHIIINFSMRRPSGGCYFRTTSLIENRPRSILREHVAPLRVEMPPGYGHSEEEDAEAARTFNVLNHSAYDDVRRLNVVPDDGSLVPLIEAFGQACLQMRSLKSAELTTTIPHSIETDTGETLLCRSLWGLWYVCPNAPSGRGRSSGLNYWGPDFLGPAFFEDPEQGRLLWAVKDWRPSPELSSLLRNIGRERYGEQLTEKFLECRNTLWKEDTLQRWRELRNRT